MYRCRVRRLQRKPIRHRYCHITPGSQLLRHRPFQCFIPRTPASPVDQQHPGIPLTGFLFGVKHIQVKRPVADRSVDQVLFAGHSCRQLGEDGLDKRVIFFNLFEGAAYRVGGIAWKACLLGHGHPTIQHAAQKQVYVLFHVFFLNRIRQIWRVSNTSS